MRTKDFCAIIEKAVFELSDQTVEFETVPYLDANGEPKACLGICLVKRWHFAVVIAKAAELIAKNQDLMFDDDDLPDTLEDFTNLVGGMHVAPYMQWTCIYFPGLTQEQIDNETGEE